MYIFINVNVNNAALKASNRVLHFQCRWYVYPALSHSKLCCESLPVCVVRNNVGALNSIQVITYDTPRAGWCWNTDNI